MQEQEQEQEQQHEQEQEPAGHSRVPGEGTPHRCGAAVSCQER